MITMNAHFGNVHAFDLDGLGRAMRAAAKYFDDLISDEAQDRDDDEAARDTDKLCEELPEAAPVEQADDLAGCAIPSFAVFAVREQAEGQTAPGAVDAVDADRTDRVVNAALVPEEHTLDYEDAGNDTDDARTNGIHEGAWRGDRDQTGEHAVAHHGRI